MNSPETTGSRAPARKVVIVIPAYNVAPVLAKTVAELPPRIADEIVVVDDGSHDGTGALARSMGVVVVTHERNRGYGAAQKSGYGEALRRGADFVVLVHGDNQYAPGMASLFVAKMANEGYDVVTGTRMVLGDVLSAGMPIWKFFANRVLTGLENLVFRTRLSDFHNGYRAYSRRFLAEIPLDLLSDYYDFDTDIIVQAALRKTRIAEIPIPTRYRDENSQMSFRKGVRYGLRILGTIAGYLLHRMGLAARPIYEGL